MMHSTKIRFSVLSSVLLALAVLGSSQSAAASPSYPAAMEKALTALYPGFSFCVPQCTACHLTTEGGPGRHNVFGDNLFLKSAPPPLVGGQTDAAVQASFQRYFANNPGIDSDGDGVSDLVELQRGDSPSLPGVRGEGQFCPDIKYGCGARIAAVPPPPVDRSALLAAGVASLLGLSLFRRRARARRTAR